MPSPTPSPAVTLPVAKVTLITGDGADQAILSFALPPAVYPFTPSNPAYATMAITAGTGLAYLMEHMTGVPLTVVACGRTGWMGRGHDRYVVDWTARTLTASSDGEVFDLDTAAQGGAFKRAKLLEAASDDDAF